MRESKGGKQNPIFFLPAERARLLDPLKIGVVAIKTSDIPLDAVLYRGPDDFLKEVRSEGAFRIPVSGVRKHFLCRDYYQTPV